MYSNLLKHSIRALKRQKSYVIINVGGLALGIACSLIIALFIRQQLSFDQYHEKKDRIHQLVLNGMIGGNEFKGGFTAAVIGPALQRELPEVESSLRINQMAETVVKFKDKFFIENNFIEADSSFFDFFSIKLLKGNSQTALSQPHTIVLTQSTATRLFGEADPMDQLIKMGNNENLYRITGIIEDIPENTHFKANMIGSFISNPRSIDNNWLANSFSTYILVHKGADLQQINDGIQELLERNIGPQIHDVAGITLEEFFQQGNRYTIFTQPLTAIQLTPGIEQLLCTPGDPRYLNIFGSIAVLILLIAAMNFMNLSTAQATKRAKEVGVKKVSGSSQGLLLGQFLIETILLSFIAMIMAIFFTELSLPLINRLLDIALVFDYLDPWYTLPLLMLISAVIGVLAGIYPAFYLSSFNPVRVLKGSTGNKNELINLRRVLTTLQFSISIVLIVGTLIMHRQISFMLTKNLGFDKEHVVVLRRAEVLTNKLAGFKNELLTIPGVVSVSASTAVPGRNNNNNGHQILGSSETYVLQTNWVDYDYLQTYGMELADGRFFDRGIITDREACIINQRTVSEFNFDDPFNIRFLDGNQQSTPIPVIGVVKDFHHESLRTEIQPYILKFKPDEINQGYISIRITPGDTRRVVEEIENVWNEFTAQEPMLYFFMNDDFARLYKEERQFAALSVIFTILAVIIASLGLYGLTAFSISQKTKEIGIRKTFGASTMDIWVMVVKEIIILIVISTAIAWPLTYLVADTWLSNYFYRINLNPMDFLKGFLLAATIAVITISYKAIKAASVNPSLSLRYE